MLLEAQAAGLPIVSFDCPTGPAEIVTDGVNGYLIPTYDTDAMARRVNEIIEDDVPKDLDFKGETLKIHAPDIKEVVAGFIDEETLNLQDDFSFDD